MGDEKKGKYILKSILFVTFEPVHNLFHIFVPRRGQSAVPGPADQDGVESDDSCENPSSQNDSVSSPLTFPATCQGRLPSFGRCVL